MEVCLIFCEASAARSCAGIKKISQIKPQVWFEDFYAHVDLLTKGWLRLVEFNAHIYILGSSPGNMNATGRS